MTLPPFGPSVASLCHPWFTTTKLSYRFPIFETSAAALCGTSGTAIIMIKDYHSIISVVIYTHIYICMYIYTLFMVSSPGTHQTHGSNLHPTWSSSKSFKDRSHSWRIMSYCHVFQCILSVHTHIYMHTIYNLCYIYNIIYIYISNWYRYYIYIYIYK